ncbi:MAG TPA: helix-turn-helix transcriptional regulator [Thermoanaerobaculia bacterium]|jgi:transcriptional regulator with XRE-family HTH domain
MDVVLKLRELRRMRQLTQVEAAEKAGIGEKTLSTFETGERIGSMKLSQFVSLLTAYDVTPAEFFGGAVERKILAELERLSAEETRLIESLRRIDEGPRNRLIARFMSEIEAVETCVSPRRLRAV